MPRILIEIHPNNVHQTYHLNALICKGYMSSRMGLMSEEEKANISQEVSDLFDALTDIPGVVDVSLNKYAAPITIDPVFTWAEVTPKVIHALEDFWVKTAWTGGDIIEWQITTKDSRHDYEYSEYGERKERIHNPPIPDQGVELFNGEPQEPLSGTEGEIHADNVQV